MSSSDFNAIILMEDVIAIRKKGKNSTIKSKEIKITDNNMIKLVTVIRELIESLILSKGSWKANNNSYLMYSNPTYEMHLKTFQEMTSL